MLPVERPASRAALRWGSAVLAVLLLAWLVDFRHVGDALRRIGGLALVAGLLLNLATRLAAALRTWLLSRGARLPVSLPHTIRALFIANFWAMVIPGVSAGSVATVLQYRRQGAGVAQSLAVLAASRVVELAAFATIAMLGILLASERIGSRGPSLAGLLAIVVLGPVAALLLLRRLLPPRPVMARPEETIVTTSTSPTTAGIDTAPRGYVGAARAKLRETLQLLAGLPNEALLAGAAIALLQAVLDAATLLVLAQGLDLPLLLSQALWINALSYFAILLPLSVAGLGLREAAILAALLPLGIARTDALALALLMLAMTLGNAVIGALLQLGVRPVARLRPAAPG